jgi:hypothetical protein
MPQAPLAHHNQDSTHITYDVITAAADAGAVELEGSVFHGAEPDENRWNIQSALSTRTRDGSRSGYATRCPTAVRGPPRESRSDRA